MLLFDSGLVIENPACKAHKSARYLSHVARHTKVSLWKDGLGHEERV